MYVFILACVTFASYTVATKSQKDISNLTIQNLEALVQSTREGGSEYVRNFKSGDVWLVGNINMGISVHYTKPSLNFGVNIEKIKCCLNGTDMDACNFSLEDSKCAQYVTRNAY